jgi:putative DNA primase/helicase
MNIYHDVIRNYINLGFAPTPMKFRSKQPINKEWNKLAISVNDIEAYFDGTPQNIGILTGLPSGGLVDVDIDDAEALIFAPYFLPRTNCIFGHLSKLKSHWLYRVPDARAHVEFKASGAMLFEIRGNNRCTVFPGSIHENGEPIEFENPDDYEPSRSTWKVLKRAGSKIAIATELFKIWSPGIRHELALCTAAKLARLGWTEPEVRELITAIATEANDEELTDRLLAVETTFASYAQGKPISGKEKFTELLGPETAENCHKWACSPDSLKIPPSPGAENVSRVSTVAADLSTESGTADAFAAEFKNRLIYCNQRWFLRKNQVFEPVDPEVVQGLAKGFLQSQVGKATAASVALPFLKGCLSRARINATVELSRSSFQIDPDAINSDVTLIGCCDGSVVDLNTRMRAKDDLAFVTKKLGANLTTGASCPTWMKFLRQIFNNNLEVIEFVRRAVGYSLSGLVSEQCLFILVGTGANGKTTLLRTLHHLFGDYAGSIPMTTLMEQKFGSQQSNDLAFLVGKRFVAASEGERGQRLAESKIKLMTGGDPIVCRAMYKDFFEFFPQFKLWLATNELPTIIGTNEAIWRRIMVIEFPVTIPPEERDSHLTDRLLLELPGILSWAMEGYRDWKQRGLDAPVCVKRSTCDYRDENDSVGQWLEAACVQESNLRSTMKDLYCSYREWCENSGLEAIQNSSFGKELTRRGFQGIRGRDGNARRGIGLKLSPQNSAVVAFTSRTGRGVSTDAA